jgi:hypothetical protein
VFNKARVMERPPYLSLHTPYKAAMSQQIALTRQIIADYVWVANGIEYLRNGPTLHSKN